MATCIVKKRFSGTWPIRARFGSVLYVLSLICIIGLQYRIPDNIRSTWGVHPGGARYFENILLGWHPSQLSQDVFSAYLIFLLFAIWAGYGILVCFALRGVRPKTDTLIGAVVVCAVACAFLWPTSLSFDPYAYVATGRLKVLYGLNPYLYPGNYLFQLHDEVARFNCGSIPTPYGSAWTALSVAIVWILKSAGVWWQVVAMKLIGAVSLVIAALCGRWIAERMHPGTGNISLLAIGLNPLLLIEGPGSGHNDLFMIAMFMVGIVLLMRKNCVAGALFLGISVGVKFVTVIALPWLIWEYYSGEGAKKGIVKAAAILLAAILPSLICYLLLWNAPSLCKGILNQVSWCMAGCQIKSAKPANIEPALIKNAPILLMYAVLSIWVFVGKKNMRWLPAWVVMSIMLVFTSVRCPFPWYVSWAVIPALVELRGNRRTLSWVCMGIGAGLMILYAVPV